MAATGKQAALFLCLFATVLGQENHQSDIENTSALVWVFIAVLFVWLALVTTALGFYIFVTQKKIKNLESKLRQRRRSSSISSDGRYSYKGLDSRSSSFHGRYEQNPIRQPSPPRIPDVTNRPQQVNGHTTNGIYDDTVTMTPPSLPPAVERPTATASLPTNSATETATANTSNHPVNEVITETTAAAATTGHTSTQDSTMHSTSDPKIDAYQVTDVPLRGEYVDVPGYEEEYTEVFTNNTSPEMTKMKAVKHVHKRPTSSDEYTDPVRNGIEQKRKMKSATINAPPVSASHASPATAERRSSESALKRSDREDWPVKNFKTPPQTKRMDESDI